MWISKDVLEATGGTLRGNEWEACGVSIDSRTVKPGELFVAIVGDRFDGHDYIKEAFDRGATAALISKAVEDCNSFGPCVEVQDTFAALNDMAVFSRKRTAAKIVAVTGSVGKTGAKEALAHVLKTGGKTYASHGNYNNHIGVPLSMVNMPQDADYAVFELGMNHAGEISYLTRLLSPDVAIITAIEAVHLEFFPSVDAIADAKAEIFEGMDETGIAILNHDNPYFSRLKECAENKGISHVLSFGTHEASEGRMLQYRVVDTGSEIETSINNIPLTYRVGALGRHWGMIATATLLAADILHCDIALAAEALESFREPEGRGRLHHIKWQGGYITLIDDSYNASPSSMMTAFSKLNDLHKALDRKGHKIAILGDMLELGLSGKELHAGLAAGIEKNDINKVYASGPLMQELYNVLPPEKRGGYANDAKAMKAMVMSDIAPEDVVLVKGSHGSNMHKVVAELKDGDGGAPMNGICTSGVENAV